MFNGTIQSVPTITALPAQLAPTKMSQPILQTALPCQILGQTSLVLTQVTSGPAESPPAFPITLAVAGVTNHGQKRPSGDSPGCPRAQAPPRRLSARAPTQGGQPSLTPASDRKKTKEQIAHLKASFLQSQFPDDAEVYRLIEVTGPRQERDQEVVQRPPVPVSTGHRPHHQRIPAKDQLALAAFSPRPHMPMYPDFTPQKFKEKTQGQVKGPGRQLEKLFRPKQNWTGCGWRRLSRREIDPGSQRGASFGTAWSRPSWIPWGLGKKGPEVASPTVLCPDLTSSLQCPAGQLCPASPAITKKSRTGSSPEEHVLARTQWPTAGV